MNRGLSLVLSGLLVEIPPNQDFMVDSMAEPRSLEEAGHRWGFNGTNMFAHAGILRRSEWIRRCEQEKRTDGSVEWGARVQPCLLGFESRTEGALPEGVPSRYPTLSYSYPVRYCLFALHCVERLHATWVQVRSIVASLLLQLGCHTVLDWCWNDQAPTTQTLCPLAPWVDSFLLFSILFGFPLADRYLRSMLFVADDS